MGSLLGTSHKYPATLAKSGGNVKAAGQQKPGKGEANTGEKDERTA